LWKAQQGLLTHLWIYVDIQNRMTSCAPSPILRQSWSVPVLFMGQRANQQRHGVRSADDPGAVPCHGQGLGVWGAAHRARRWEDELQALCMDTQAPCREGDGWMEMVILEMNR
jgi:hypothetical protein